MCQLDLLSRRELLASGVGAVALAATAEAAETKSITIPATDLAPSDKRADEPTPGKWWLKRGVEGVPGGAMLMTGKVEEQPVPKNQLGEWNVISADLYATPYRVPALEIDPKLKGWHRITVGLFNRIKLNEHYMLPPRLLARLSDEPYPEYLMAPQSATTTVVETEWRVADLTGKSLRFEQAPAAMSHPGRGWIGGISHIKFTPLTEAEVAAARKRETVPPAEGKLFGLLDTPDEIFWWGTLESPDDMRAIIYRHERAGFGRVYFRAWGSMLENSHAVPDANPRWTEADEKAFCARQKCPVGWQPYIDLPKKFDMLKVASDYAKEHGMEVHAWLRLTNLNRAPYCEFWHKHPEFNAMLPDKDGKPAQRYARVLSFAHPEVRAFYVSFCKQIASTGTPGILLDLLRHPPLSGFEAVGAERFKKKFGVDMMSRITPKQRAVEALIADPMINEHQQDLLEDFLKELRAAIGPKIEIGVRSSGPDKYGLRGKAWIDAGLIQTIMDGNWYSGNGLRPTIGATIAAAGTKGKAFAIAESYNVDIKTGGRKPGSLDTEAILGLAKLYKAKGVHRFGLYESTEFTWRPELRRAIREAGWLMAEKGAG